MLRHYMLEGGTHIVSVVVHFSPVPSVLSRNPELNLRTIVTPKLLQQTLVVSAIHPARAQHNAPSASQSAPRAPNAAAQSRPPQRPHRPASCRARAARGRAPGSRAAAGATSSLLRRLALRSPSSAEPRRAPHGRYAPRAPDPGGSEDAHGMWTRTGAARALPIPGRPQGDKPPCADGPYLRRCSPVSAGSGQPARGHSMGAVGEGWEKAEARRGATRSRFASVPHDRDSVLRVGPAARRACVCTRALSMHCQACTRPISFSCSSTRFMCVLLPEDTEHIITCKDTYRVHHKADAVFLRMHFSRFGRVSESDGRPITREHRSARKERPETRASQRKKDIYHHHEGRMRARHIATTYHDETAKRTA